LLQQVFKSGAAFKLGPDLTIGYTPPIKTTSAVRHYPPFLDSIFQWLGYDFTPIP
jgi:hypothetical protein